MNTILMLGLARAGGPVPLPNVPTVPVTDMLPGPLPLASFAVMLVA